MLNIEAKTAATILESPLAELNLGGEVYRVPAPTTATLIMVSQWIAELPEMQDLETEGNPLDNLPVLLSTIRDCDALGHIAATLILGAKRIKAEPWKEIVRTTTVPTSKGLFRRKKIKTAKHKERVLHLRWLAELVLENMTVRELNEFIVKVLAEGYISDFFVLTTSLRGKNQIKQTREVEKTTPSGHS